MTSKTLLARFDQSPSLVNPDMQMRFESCIEQAGNYLVANADKMVAHNDNATHNEDGYWPEADEWLAAIRPYKVVNGTLLIPVKGVLLHNFSYALFDWATGYDYIARALARGLADANVLRIALVVDSPGGEVAGCFECADKIYAGRSLKPIRAFAHESAYSAAYALASAAGEITVSRTGGVGSIGVVTTHMDVSDRMEKLGVKMTFIFAGKHKVDGNAYEPLPEAVRAKIQTRIDELYGVFVAAVSRHRGIDESAVRATEAACFTATEALSNGLADAVGPLDESMASFEAGLSNQTENETMSTQKDDSALDQAAEAAIAAARTEAKTEGQAEGAQSERQRISAIEGSDEAKTRPVAARNVAMETNMSVEDAKAFLAKMPEEKPAQTEEAGAGAGANRFNNAMKQTGNPDLDGNDEASGNDDKGTAFTGQAGTNALVAARAEATGFGRKPKQKQGA